MEVRELSTPVVVAVPSPLRFAPPQARGIRRADLQSPALQRLKKRTCGYDLDARAKVSRRDVG